MYGFHREYDMVRVVIDKRVLEDILEGRAFKGEEGQVRQVQGREGIQTLTLGIQVISFKRGLWRHLRDPIDKTRRSAGQYERYA
jgi:hypothetical protein